MHNDGITEAVTVVLAPHYSSFSVGSYNKRAKEEADKYGYNYIMLNVIINNLNLLNTGQIK